VQDINIITPKKSLFNLQLNEIWRYRDLLVLFAKRDIAVLYKQTILGPLWFFIQPLLTTLMFLLVFNKIAGISTDGIPPLVFYMAGVTVWNYFSDCLRLTSDTFTKNASIFGKVYFPRVVIPLSIIISNLIKFIIQFCLFIAVYVYFYININSLRPNSSILLLPFYIVIVAFLALSFGLMISALTTKYRDLTFLIQFGIQLAMYVTPVIYPLSKIPEKYKIYILLNPVSSVMEAFKYSFTGEGFFSLSWLTYSLVFALISFDLSLAVFNRIEKTFMDTV
jgi:lipopolysaccharide transport system permease protein